MPRPSLQYCIRNVRSRIALVSCVACCPLRVHERRSRDYLLLGNNNNNNQQQDEIAEAGKRLVRVSLGGQVDFLGGMRVQQMQIDLDDALNGGTTLPFFSLSSPRLSS